MPLYGRTAVAAARHLQRHPRTAPLTAWTSAVAAETQSNESRRKGWPRTTFLGICEEGLVAGVPEGEYREKPRPGPGNKEYALEAARLIGRDRGRDWTKSELAVAVQESLGLDLQVGNGAPSLARNGQMDVVLSLHEAGLLSLGFVGRWRHT